MIKRNRRNAMIKKLAVMFCAVALIVGAAIGGTLAWLVDDTEAVTNTFTVGDINIMLDETTGNSYDIIPGNNITKDPKVTVLANSEDCWVLVKVDISDWPINDAISYNWGSDWTVYSNNLNTVNATENSVVSGTIWLYTTVSSQTTDKELEILANNTITVTGDLTKDDVNSIKDNLKIVTGEGDNAVVTYRSPEMIFTAYAVQNDSNINTIDKAYDVALDGQLTQTNP